MNLYQWHQRLPVLGACAPNAGSSQISLATNQRPAPLLRTMALRKNIAFYLPVSGDSPRRHGFREISAASHESRTPAQTLVPGPGVRPHLQSASARSIKTGVFLTPLLQPPVLRTQRLRAASVHQPGSVFGSLAGMFRNSYFFTAVALRTHDPTTAPLL